MDFAAQDLYTLRSSLESAQNILLMSHASPDGDTLGCGLAWYQVLTELGKNVTNFCINPFPLKQRFLPNWETYTDSYGDFAAYDLIIINDHGDIKLTGLTKEENKTLLNSGTYIINIDHHPSNNYYGDLNIVITYAASTTQIITELFSKLHIKISPDVATSLLNGLYTDTGSFQHDNTSPEALKAASMLMSRGANFKSIAQYNFHNRKISTLKLWGKVFENITHNEKHITSSVITTHDMTEVGAGYEDLEGAIDFLNHIPETYFTLLLSERNDIIKGSLRTTRDDVDVAYVAKHFNGGGHKKAAGFAVTGKLNKNGKRWEIVENASQID